MAIRFLSGQTIDGNLTVSGNVQAATFNSLPIATGRNNQANKIVRTQGNGYVDFGWINSTSGNHTGSITRITASNDEYLRYVTPAQFRTNVTDGYYAPASTVSGVTSVATGNGLTGGTITSTGTLTMSGSYSGDFAISGTSGTGGNALSVIRGSDGSSAFRVQNTGEVVVNSNYFYAASSGVSMYVQNTAVFRGAIMNDGSNAPVRIADDLTIDADLTVTGGDIVLGGTGRIQGVDTVSASTDAANKAYVDAHTGSGGTVTSVATGNGLTGGTITTTGTLSMSGTYTGNYVITGGLSVQGYNIFGMGLSTGSWYGDLGSNGYTRETGLAMTGGSEFVVVSKNGQGSVLVDGAYLAYEGANGFFGSYNSSYGNLTGIQATGANTITVKQLDGGTASLTITNTLNSNSYANQSGGLLFSAGQTTGTPTSLNLRTSSPTADPSTSDQGGSTGITWGQRNDSNPYYIIYPKLENWNSSGNYSKLTLAWHTGIKIGADKAYGGTRFYNQSPDISGASLIMNVGVGSDDINILKNLEVDGAMYQQPSSIGGYIVKPKGADFFTASSQQTGAIEIRFPTGGSQKNDMVFFTVDVYQYSTNRSFSIKAGGYIYQGIGSNTWINVFAQVYAKNSNQNYTVRFGDNGSTHCMWIGESTDSWSYTQVIVRDFFGGYATNINEYKEGWDITFDSLSGKTINNTLTNNFPLAQDVIGTGYLPLSGGTMTGSIAMSNNNITGIGSLTLNNGWRLQNGGSNYASINSWVYLEGVHGLYTGTNGAHFYPNNDSTYGSWKITGSRNSWNGITFGGSGGTHNTLMSSADGATMGLFNDTDDEWYIECIRNGTAKLYYDGNLKLETTSSGTMTQGTAEATGDMRAPIFYDSNDTNYYVNPNATSNVVDIALKGKISFPTNSLGNTSGNAAYAIYQESGAWTFPYPDLRIAMHTGIKFGANQSYNGMRFYDDYTMATQVMSVNNGSDGLGAQNVFVNNSLQAGSSLRAPIFYDSNDTAYYGDFASTSNFNTLTLAGSLTVQSGSGTMNGKATQLFEHGYGSDSGTFYQTSGSFAGYSGWANYWIGNHGNGATYYNTVDIRPFWGPPKYSRLEGGTFRGPYNYVTNEVDQTIGVYLQSTTSLRAPIFYDYNNTAFYLDPSTTGTSVNVAGDVVAYASSDIRFKNNVTPITNALDKLSKIGGYTFEWNEISHKETGKKDIGVVAQEVEEILPEIVQTRSNGYKAVDYQKLTALLIESVKEQQFIIDDLKSRIERLEKI
tara:strand:+ start:10326 stop:14093 length:3768 start_codon:yes stop_codon:yes gene_type:complete